MPVLPKWALMNFQMAFATSSISMSFDASRINANSSATVVCLSPGSDLNAFGVCSEMLKIWNALIVANWSNELWRLAITKYNWSIVGNKFSTAAHNASSPLTNSAKSNSFRAYSFELISSPFRFSRIKCHTFNCVSSSSWCVRLTGDLMVSCSPATSANFVDTYKLKMVKDFCTYDCVSWLNALPLPLMFCANSFRTAIIRSRSVSVISKRKLEIKLNEFPHLMCAKIEMLRFTWAEFRIECPCRLWQWDCYTPNRCPKMNEQIWRAFCSRFDGNYVSLHATDKLFATRIHALRSL